MATETEGTEANETESPPTDAQPIFRGIQRDISDQKELSEYALSLERQNLEMQARLGGLGVGAREEAPQAPVDDSAFYRTVSEEFIIAPQTAIKRIEDRIYDRVNGQVESRIGVTEFYRSFYDENEDLVGCEDLVEAALTKNREAWKRIPTPQAKKLLANAVRERVSAIRGVESTTRTTELPQRGAHALGASGTPGKAAGGPKPAEGPKTIIEALKAQRAKHGG